MQAKTTFLLMQQLGLNEARIASRLEQLNLVDADRQLLQNAWPSVEGQLQRFATELYAKFERSPRLKAILAHESRVARLIELQQVYLQQLFLNPLDQNYVAGRIAIGLVHHRTRVTPQWYMATYSHFLCSHVDVLLEQSSSVELGIETVIAFMKSLFFDAALVLDAYGLSEFATANSRRRGNGGHGERPEVPKSESLKRESLDRKDNSRQITRIQLSDDEVTERASFIELTEGDLTNLRSMKQIFEKAVPEVLTDFYQYIQQSAEFRQLVAPHQIDRLMQQVNSYWQEFISSNFDRAYAVSRTRVGVIHEQLGICPQSYLAGLARQVSGFLRCFPSITKHPAELIKSFFRGLIFDVTFIIDAYMESRVESLLRTEGYASQLMTGLNASIVIVDKNRQIRYANDQLVELVGIEPSLMYMMRLEDALQFKEAIAALERVLEGQFNRTSFVSRWNYNTYRVSAMELKESEEYRADVFALVLDDVSDLAKISSTIEEDGENYARLSNAVPAVLWEIDLNTNSIVMISKQSFEVTGFRAVYFLGRANAWKDQLSPEDQPKFMAALTQAIVGKVTVCEYRMIRADGQQVWLRSHFSRLADTDYRLVAITIDISDVRVAEERKMSALQLLAGGVSHSFNNALAAVLSNIELHKLESGDTSQFLYLDRALQAGHRAANVLAHLQAYAGGQRLRPSHIQLNKLIEKVILNLRASFGPLQVELRLAEELWPCYVDEVAMIGSLEQICFNAIQAIQSSDPASSLLVIRTSNLTHDQLASSEAGFGADWVELCIEDNGVGMEPTVLSKATDPFFTTHSKDQSDGLGLSMVYGFVAQSGGHLQIASDHGRGTQVRLLLPKSSRNQPNIPVSPPGPRSILIVDDDADVAMSTAHLIKQFGYQVRYVTSSHAALQALDEKQADLMLVDLLLHDGVDGQQLAIMAMKKYSGLRVIAMSGHSKFSVDPESSEVEIPYISKPFSAKQLFDALAHAFSPKP